MPGRRPWPDGSATGRLERPRDEPDARPEARRASPRADDAELVTAAGKFEGAEAIGRFYRDNLFRSADLRPSPGPLIVDGNRVAVEIDLLTGGRHIAVGDFFTIDGDKIRRLVIFFGHELT